MTTFVRRQFSIDRLIGLVAVLLSTFPMVVVAGEQDNAMAAWARVLSDFVDESGRIDFRQLADSPQDLESVVSYIGKHGPMTSPNRYTSNAQTLAFHLNAYNALAMYGVIQTGIPKGFNSILKRASFFKFRKVLVDGQRLSLSAYENNVIRRLNEARAHFALNCMVKDCPRLPREPFRAANLNEQLEKAATEFFNQSKYLSRLPEKRQVLVSKILDFYTEDFAASGKQQDLIPYINQFLENPIPKTWTVEFMDYDWTINQQP